MSACVVSLHDVSPLTREVFTSMLAELAKLGITKTSLLVIPDHHHRGHMLADVGFCQWLEGLARQGHELVIHGYYHQRPTRSGETVRQSLITRIYTRGEGEFYDLPKDEAAVVLQRAREDFQQLDAPHPTGFIAPAWLLGPEAREAVQEAGFRYTTYLTGVQVLAAHNGSRQEFEPAQSIVYSCQNLWRRTCSLGWSALLRFRLRNAPLLRLALHPPDIQHARIWEQIRRFIRAEAARRAVMTYEHFVETIGSRSSPAL